MSMQVDRAVRAFSRPYAVQDDRLAWTSFLGSYAAYLGTLALAVWAAHLHWALALPLIVVNAFAGVRLYVLQHDCGHHSLFVTRRMNDLAGALLSVVTLTPYRVMQFNHNEHHAHLGNLDERHTTEIYTMTVREWETATWSQRLLYRLYRHPLVLIPVGGFWTYLFAYRWPKNAARVGAAGVLAHNAALLAWVGLIWLLGGLTGLAVWFGTVIVAGWIGVFLVYLQHNFEDTWWDRKPGLVPMKAQLKGSSALDLGWWWDLGTGNIAYHDIHHYNPRIPSYRLRECHRALRQEFDCHIIRWPEALRSFSLRLWDEEQQRLVPFPKTPRRAPNGGLTRA
jgi:omega-6 fatty acid desaturase (delta-12 desaturase)